MGVLSKLAGLALFTLILCSSALPAVAADGKWDAIIRPMVDAGTGTADYSAELFAPVYQTNSSLFFIAPKFRYNPGLNDSNEVNIGLGYRQLIMNDAWFVGGNVYYDTMDSPLNNRYHQIGLGVEARSKDFDVFLNGYIPVGTTKNSIASLDRFSLGEHSLMRRNGVEEALTGMDGEVGALIPYLSDYVETRAYVGGYWWLSDVGSDIAGVRGRVQINPVPLVTVNGIYSYDHARNSVWRGEAYLNIPFSVTNIFEGKNPFAGIKEAVAFGKGARDAKARMTDRVERDRYIQTDVGTEKTAVKDHAIIYVDNSTEVAPEDQDGSLSRPYSFLTGDDNSAQHYIDAHPGSADLPYIYLFAGNGTYTGGLDLTYGMTADSRNAMVWGEHYALPGMTAGGRPVIDGDYYDDYGVYFDGKGSLTVRGLEIDNCYYDGIYASGLSKAYISDNVLNNNGWGGGAGININTVGPADIDINHNAVNNDCGYGIYVYADDDGLSGDTNINISDNTVNDSAYDGIYVDVYNTGASGNINMVVANNTLDNNGYYGDDGMYLYSELDGTGDNNMTITGNTVNGSGYSGIYAEPEHYGTGNINVLLSGNTANGNGGDGLCVYAEHHGTGDIILAGIGNTSNNNIYGNGIIVEAYNYGDTGNVDMTVLGNTADNNTYGGIYCYADSYSTGNITMAVNNNIANDNYYDGIYAYAFNYGDTGNVDMTVSGNTAGNNGYLGVYCYADSYSTSGNITMAVNNNHASYNEYSDGIYAGAYNYSDTGNVDVTVSGNTTGYNGGYGIYSEAYNYADTGNVDMTVSGNTAGYNGGDGINAYAYNEAAGSASLTVSGNNAENNGYDGICAYVENNPGGGNATLTVSNNTALYNGDLDLWMEVFNYGGVSTDDAILSGSGNIVGNWDYYYDYNSGDFIDTLTPTLP